MAVVRFYTDIVEKHREDETVAYEAVEWSIRCPWSETLEERVEKATDAWLNRAMEVSSSEAAAEVRAKRNSLLVASDAEMAFDRQQFDFSTTTKFVASVKAAVSNGMAEYRQALRDITEQPGFPFDIIWPEKPTKVNITDDVIN